MSEREKTILSNPLNRLVFAKGEGIYLVGGYLRELLGRGKHSKDLDFVTAAHPAELVKGLSLMLNARVVLLGKGLISRLVLQDGTTLDFSIVNQDLIHDLTQRDFTVNTMAWSPESGLVDPLGGLADIKNGLVRGISKRNFEDDPLRILRAYRLMAENSWTIEHRSRHIMRGLAEKIRHAARERITLEFFKLLSAEEPMNALETALEDRVLTKVISLSYGQLQKNLQLVSRIRTNLEKIPEIHHLKFSSQGLNYAGLLRLEQLLRGSDIEGNLFRMSVKISRRIFVVDTFYKRFEELDGLRKGEVFDLFSMAGEVAPDLLILTGHLSYLKEYKRFRRIIHGGLLSAEEIMRIKGISQGPGLGQLIYKAKRRQFECGSGRKSEAIMWLKKEQLSNA